MERARRTPCRLRIGAALLILAGLLPTVSPPFTAAAGPAVAPSPYTIAPPVPVSPPVYGPQWGGAQYVDSASDGSGYLRVWWGGGVVVGARFAGDGTRVDPASFQIAGPPLSREAGALVVWTGSRYLLIWQSTAPQLIMGRFVYPTGAPLRSRVFDIDPQDKAFGGYIDAAANGTETLIVWVDSRHRLLADLVAPNGSVLKADIPVTTSGGWYSELSVASDGSDFMVAPTKESFGGGHADQVAVIVHPNGTQEPATIITEAGGDQTSPAAAWAGTVYLVAWCDSRSASVRAARLDASGQVLDSAGIDVAVGGPPSVGSDGGQFLVVWAGEANPHPVRATRITQDGHVEDPGGFDISSWSCQPYGPVIQAASNGDGFVVAFLIANVCIYGVSQLATVAVSPGGETGPSMLLSISAPGQRNGRIAWGGDQYLAVWTESPTVQDVPRLMGGRLSPTGEPLDGIGFFISGADPRDAPAGPPIVGWDGSLFLLVWETPNRRLLAARVAPDGTVLDRDGIELPTTSPFHQASVAGVNGLFLVVWQEKGSLQDIVGTRINDAGTVLDPKPLEIAAFPGQQGQPAVAWSGRQFLVAWVDDRLQLKDIFAARVTPAGNVRDPSGFLVAGGESVQTAPVVAGDGSGHWLVAWQEGGGTPSSVNSAAVSRVAAVSSPVTVVTGPGYLAVHHSVAWDETSFLVTWERCHESVRRHVMDGSNPS